MAETTVISVRGKDRAALLADPAFVYVGRRCAGWPASVWGNPYKPELVYIGQRPRMTAEMRALAVQQCLLCYRGWLTARLQCEPATWDLSLLRGKRLGCWCCDYDGVSEPMPLCHAAVLARLANGLDVKIA